MVNLDAIAGLLNNQLIKNEANSNSHSCDCEAPCEECKCEDSNERPLEKKKVVKEADASEIKQKEYKDPFTEEYKLQFNNKCGSKRKHPHDETGCFDLKVF